MRQRSGGMVILAISIIAGLIAATLSVSLLTGVARTTTVLVASQEIPAFTPLTPAMFDTKTLPNSAVPADSVKDPAGFIGRYARTILLPGTVLRAGHLASSSGAAGSVAAKLTETGQAGMRAIAIPVDNATGVGGTIQAGDRVDLIAAVRIDRQNAPATSFAKVIARNVAVLHRTESEGTSKSTVVVMVPAQLAEDIAFAQTAGAVYLATTPYKSETDTEKTLGVTPDSFIQRYGK